MAIAGETYTLSCQKYLYRRQPTFFFYFFLSLFFFFLATSGGADGYVLEMQPDLHLSH